MRKQILSRAALLLSLTAGFVAACDNQQPTSPNSIASSRSAGGNLAPAAQASAPKAQAKPTDSVGFTKITHVAGIHTVVPVGGAQSLTVVCPAGTSVVGGGFEVVEGPTRISASKATNANGWIVGVDNTQGAFPVGVIPHAYCLS